MTTTASSNQENESISQAQDYPVDLDTVDQDLDIAQKAAVIHVALDWPSGQLCRNCHERWPCRLARWGTGVLHAAGWSDEDVTTLIQRAEAGDVPWA